MRVSILWILAILAFVSYNTIEPPILAYGVTYFWILVGSAYIIFCDAEKEDTHD